MNDDGGERRRIESKFDEPSSSTRVENGENAGDTKKSKRKESEKRVEG